MAPAGPQKPANSLQNKGCEQKVVRFPIKITKKHGKPLVEQGFVKVQENQLPSKPWKPLGILGVLLKRDSRNYLKVANTL